MRLLAALTLLILLGCDDKNRDYLDNSVTQSMYLLEESNRLELKEVIVEHHLSDDRSNLLNKFLVRSYNVIDLVTEDLLVKGGGYNENGFLVEATNTQVGIQVFNDHNIVNKISLELVEFKKDVEELSLPYKKETIQDIENILEPFLGNKFNNEYLEKTMMADLYLQLLIIQNRLLVAEVKYYERLRSEEKNNKEESMASKKLA